MTHPEDPAYWMLQQGLKEQACTPEEYKWRTQTKAYAEDCYICNDREYSLMGLPLCRTCSACIRESRGLGHIAADDVGCDVCGLDEDYDAAMEQLKNEQ